jgi:hypothetical protein
VRCFDHGMEARSWTQPLAPVLSDPDAFLHLRLQVDDAWLGEAGEWRQIREESNPGLWSILGYLRWHAPELMARDPDAKALGAADAYLASRPLVAAIDAELARRGEIVPGTALLVLRAVGLAPWDLPTPRQRSRRSIG